MQHTIHDAVFQVVCDQFDVTKDDLKGPCRSRSIVRPRQIAMSLMRDAGGGRLSYPQIGHHFNRDHTTVLFGMRRVEEYREDVYFQAQYDKLLTMVDALARPAPFIRNRDVVFKSRRAQA